MTPERRRPSVMQWSILLTLWLQAMIAFYHYGRLNERVDDLVRRVDRIERLLDPSTPRH